MKKKSLKIKADITKDRKIAVHEMATASLVNLLTIKAFITKAKKGSNAVRAVEILERMREVNILSPNRIHYNVVINACATSRPALVNEAARVLSMMLESNISPTAHTLSALLRAAAFAAQPRPDLARRWFCEYRQEKHSQNYQKC